MTAAMAVGVLAMNQDNVVDRLITELPEEKKAYLHEEYSIVTDTPEAKGCYYFSLQYHEPIASWCKTYADTWGKLMRSLN